VTKYRFRPGKHKRLVRKSRLNRHNILLDFQGGYYTQAEIALIHETSRQRIGQILDQLLPNRIKQNGDKPK
jgi:hypothetical protein